jgi:hypothetical protein
MKFEFEGHAIDVAEADEFGDLAGKPIHMEFGKRRTAPRVHPVALLEIDSGEVRDGGRNLPRDEYWLLLPPGAARKRLGLSEIRPLRRPK